MLLSMAQTTMLLRIFCRLLLLLISVSSCVIWLFPFCLFLLPLSACQLLQYFFQIVLVHPQVTFHLIHLIHAEWLLVFHLNNIGVGFFQLAVLRGPERFFQLLITLILA